MTAQKVAMNRLGPILLIAVTGTLLARTELVQLRTENSRTFDNHDGTYTAEIRPTSYPPDTAPPMTSGFIWSWNSHGVWFYERGGPHICYEALFYMQHNGWVQFDLRAILDSCTVNGVRFGHFQYSWQPGVATQLTHVVYGLCSDEELFWGIINGDPLDMVYRHSYSGWVVRDLSAFGVSLVDSTVRAGSNWFTVGLKPASESGESYGTEGEQLRPFLAVTYLYDWPEIRGLEAEVTTYPVTPEEHDTIKASFVNQGIPVARNVRIKALFRGVAFDSAEVESLGSSETTVVPFVVGPFAQDSLPLEFQFAAYVAEDLDHSNDTTPLQSWVFPTGTYAATSFEQNGGFPPPGWVVIENDSGSESWQARSYSPHSGRLHAFVLHERGRNDDWLITPAIMPQAHHVDTAGLYYRSYLGGSTDSVELWVLAGQTVADTVCCIFGGKAPARYLELKLCLDDYDGDTIYLGFRCRTLSGHQGLCIDDAYFMRVPGPGVSDERPGPRTPSRGFVLTPNPVAGRYALLRYSMPSPVRTRVEIHDISGRAALTRELQLTADTDAVSLDLKALPNGVYFVRLEAEGFTATQKLVIQH